MNDELRQHLLNRRKDLSSRLVPLQSALSEVELLLRLMEPTPAVSPKTRESNSNTMVGLLKRALSEAGDDGLTAKQSADLTNDHSGNMSSRLSVMKARGQVTHVNGRYILRPDLRTHLLNGAGVSEP